MDELETSTGKMERLLRESKDLIITKGPFIFESKQLNMPTTDNEQIPEYMIRVRPRDTSLTHGEAVQKVVELLGEPIGHQRYFKDHETRIWYNDNCAKGHTTARTTVIIDNERMRYEKLIFKNEKYLEQLGEMTSAR